MQKYDVQKLLQEKDLKITEQRKQVLQTLLTLKGIFSVNTIKESLQNEMDVVTIYRILNSFVETKIIREISSKTTTKFYELACLDFSIHPHFICQNCQKIFCLEPIELQSFLPKRMSNFVTKEVNLEINGFCPKCK